MLKYGSSTGFIPNHVKKRNTMVKDQKFNDFVVLPWNCAFLFKKAKGSIIKIDITNPTTPPNLFGIDRKIAYANRKYHSGWMWVGVTNELAGVKFSGSINLYGLILLTKINKEIIKAALTMSL